MSPELRAFAYLRHIRRCPIVLFERTPRPCEWSDRPDAIGVTPARYLIEIEVKRSLADFRANAKKRHVENRQHCLKRWPKQFYFLTPISIHQRVLAELPEWAGLLAFDNMTQHYVEVIRQAPVNRESRKLTFKEAVSLAHLMANQVWATEMRMHTAMMDKRREADSPWGCEYQI